MIENFRYTRRPSVLPLQDQSESVGCVVDSCSISGAESLVRWFLFDPWSGIDGSKLKMAASINALVIETKDNERKLDKMNDRLLGKFKSNPVPTAGLLERL